MVHGPRLTQRSWPMSWQVAVTKPTPPGGVLILRTPPTPSSPRSIRGHRSSRCPTWVDHRGGLHHPRQQEGPLCRTSRGQAQGDGCFQRRRHRASTCRAPDKTVCRTVSGLTRMLQIACAAPAIPFASFGGRRCCPSPHRCRTVPVRLPENPSSHPGDR